MPSSALSAALDTHFRRRLLLGKQYRRHFRIACLALAQRKAQPLSQSHTDPLIIFFCSSPSVLLTLSPLQLKPSQIRKSADMLNLVLDFICLRNCPTSTSNGACVLFLANRSSAFYNALNHTGILRRRRWPFQGRSRPIPRPTQEARLDATQRCWQHSRFEHASHVEKRSRQDASLSSPCWHSLHICQFGW